MKKKIPEILKPDYRQKKEASASWHWTVNSIAEGNS